jgi:hypothetical protein
MSRAIFLSMTSEKATLKCNVEKVAISAIEDLPSGGIRLVCSSVHGAEVMRRKLKSHVMADDTLRFQWRPRTPLW